MERGIKKTVKAIMADVLNVIVVFVGFRKIINFAPTAVQKWTRSDL
jgi:hypothetical protein